jgi:hypothetical protein
MRIPPSEVKTLQTVAALPLIPPCGRLPLHRREAAENIPVCVQNERQSVRAAVAAGVELPSGETVAAVPPQQIETLHTEFFKQWRKFRDDQRIEPQCHNGGRRYGRVCRQQLINTVFELLQALFDLRDVIFVSRGLLVRLVRAPPKLFNFRRQSSTASLTPSEPLIRFVGPPRTAFAGQSQTSN